MKILVACEESQAVTTEFRKIGHEAFSCDILDCSGGHPEWHIKGDAIKTLYSKKWDLVIAHPPCTYMANSGARWLYQKDGRQYTPRWMNLIESLLFWDEFIQWQKATGVPLCIENPIPHKHAVNGIADKPGIGKSTQIIHPWQFGHGETKATCLWLKGLPKLIPTNVVPGREQKVWKMPPSDDRARLRSKTYPGIAAAMASQWAQFGNSISKG